MKFISAGWPYSTRTWLFISTSSQLWDVEISLVRYPFSHNHGSVENYLKWLKWKVVDPIGDTTIFSPWLWFRMGFLTLQVLKETGKDPTSSAVFCIQDRIICDLKVNNAAMGVDLRFQSLIPSKSLHFTNHQFPEIKSFLLEFPYWSTFWGKVQWHYQNWKIPSTRMIAILKKKNKRSIGFQLKIDHPILSFGGFFLVDSPQILRPII